MPPAGPKRSSKHRGLTAPKSAGGAATKRGRGHGRGAPSSSTAAAAGYVSESDGSSSGEEDDQTAALLAQLRLLAKKREKRNEQKAAKHAAKVAAGFVAAANEMLSQHNRKDDERVKDMQNEAAALEAEAKALSAKHTSRVSILHQTAKKHLDAMGAVAKEVAALVAEVDKARDASLLDELKSALKETAKAHSSALEGLLAHSIREHKARVAAKMVQVIHTEFNTPLKDGGGASSRSGKGKGKAASRSGAGAGGSGKGGRPSAKKRVRAA